MDLSWREPPIVKHQCSGMAESVNKDTQLRHTPPGPQPDLLASPHGPGTQAVLPKFGFCATVGGVAVGSAGGQPMHWTPSALTMSSPHFTLRTSHTNRSQTHCLEKLTVAVGTTYSR